MAWGGWKEGGCVGLGFRVQGEYSLGGDIDGDVEGQPGLDQPVHCFEPGVCDEGI